MTSPLRIIEISVGDSASAWRSAGFRVDSEECTTIGTVRIRFVGDGGERGILGWLVSGVKNGAIDGLREQVSVGSKPSGASLVDHPNTASILDHLVITTPDVDRTIAEFRAAGCEPRRERQAGTGDKPMRQVFIRAGEVILEIIGPKDVPESTGASPKPASLWGLAFTVADLDVCTQLLGENCGTPHDAVQTGRKIASLRHAALGISVPTVFMST